MWVLLCVLCIAATCLTGVAAASADINFSSEKNRYETGEEFNVELTVNAEVVPGDFSAFILYSSEVLEYIGESDRIAGGEGILKLTDAAVYPDRTTRKYILRFRALSRGYADIKLRDGVELYEYEDGYLMSVSSNTLSLAIGAAEEASEDTTLASLKVSPGKLSPDFLPNTTEYRVSVPYETERLIISAGPNHPEASVSIDGGVLEVGQNRIVVRVTSEAGTIGKYVIYCIRSEEEKAEENPTPTTAVEPSGTDTSNGSNGQPDEPGADTGITLGKGLTASVENGEKILFLDSSFTVADGAGNVEIPEGYTKTQLLISDIKIPVYAPSNNPSAEYLLMVLKRDGEEPALYRYDRNDMTLQLFTVTQSNAVVISPDSIEMQQLKDSYDKSLNTLTLIIAVLSGIAMVLLIIVIRLATRPGKDEID